MDLQNVLRSVHSIADLPALVVALGHEPLLEPVPYEAWNTPRQTRLDVVAVGESDGLPWFAIRSSESERDAVRLARRITSRGKAAVVLALDPDNRRLALAAAFNGVASLPIDLSGPDPEVVASLSRLAGNWKTGPLAFAARAREALSTEPVSRRFFRQFRLTVDSIAQDLPCPMGIEDRHSFTLLQLTRVLFLYFVQTKGWLSARSRFLAEEVDRCVSRGRRIHRDLLRPLFFGTLNRPLQERSNLARRFGPIPFLNGGLFEPHPLERRCKADIPNVLWCAAFDQLFERFHFTVSETGQPGSVAPDMLGRVFEGVMAPAARRASGTFYTPASLVRDILEAGITTLLASRLKCKESAAHRRLQEPDPTVVQILRGITLLDPAAGSGAFLLCALELLSGTRKGATIPAIQKRTVLQQNLFGVDLNAAAVRLAELRLWLAVIADEPDDCSPNQINPLPNLDCLIRQGDSLFEPAGLRLVGSCSATRAADSAQLAHLRHELVTASGQPKRALERRLRTAETTMFGKSLEQTEEAYRLEIAECMDVARAPDLFGNRRGLDRELSSRLRQLRSGIARVRQAQRRLRREGEVPWFHYASHFADVFARGGFDLVVGNPPWLRSEAIPQETRKQLASRYRWWLKSGTTYGNAPDLAVAFIERGMELTAPGGVLAMLVPAKIAWAGYGSAARHSLSSTTALHVLADLTASAGHCFEATVYPLALVARKAPPASGHRVRMSLRPDSSTVRQADLQGGGPWILTSGSIHQVVTRLAAEHPSLNEVLPCHLGVKTGLNQVFFDPPEWIEPTLIRWALRGRDLAPFRWRAKVRLLWTHAPTGNAVSELPPGALGYLRPHEHALRSRQDYRDGPWWTVFRTRAAQAPYRVIWADLSRKITAAALSRASDREFIPLNSCYVAPANSAVRAEAIAAWLNSSWIRAIARASAVPASGGFARFNAGSVGRVPLAISAVDDGELAQIARQGHAGGEIQEALDAVVARHLGLSPAARRTLRGSLG